MKRKELLCAMAALLLFLCVQPASALTSNQRETVIEAITRMPVISVTIPSTAQVYINPFQIPVYIEDDETDAQIISTPSAIANMSEVPLKVDVTITSAIRSGSDMQLVTTSTIGRGLTTKRAFVYFEIQKSDSPDPDDVAWPAGYDSELKSQIILSTTNAKTKKGILTLPAMTLDGDVFYAPFRLTGDAVVGPKSPWNENDGIDVKVAFTFTPLHYSENPSS